MDDFDVRAKDIILMSAVLIIICILVIGILYQFFGNEDSAIEELAEHIIENELGIDIDFSPNSKELR